MLCILVVSSACQAMSCSKSSPACAVHMPLLLHKLDIISHSFQQPLAAAISGLGPWLLA